MGVARRALLGGIAGATTLLATGETATAAPPTLDRDLAAVVAAGAVSALGETRAGGRARQAAAGTIRLDGDRPAPADGRFRAGSVIKPFVAVVVLQLADEGRLRLDDPVEKWVPGLVPGGRDITVEHLLRHTSGIADYTAVVLPDTEAFLRNRFRAYTARELVALGVGLPPMFPPGEGQEYSNTGYILLGMIIERAAGRGYAREIERRILRPLGLRDTFLPGSATRVPGSPAHVYAVAADGRPVDVTEMNPTMQGAAGELISTTADLNTFMGALVAGRLVDTTRMFDTRGTGYGLGIEVADLPYGRVIGHGGGGPGFQGVTFSSADGRRQVSAYASTAGKDVSGALYLLMDRALAPRS